MKRGGLVERAFGLTVNQLVYDYGGGRRAAGPVRAVQIGGPLGAYLPKSEFDTPLEYEALTAKNALLGHGGVVVFDDTVDMAHMARFALEFCAVESCGKCTPCRVGLDPRRGAHGPHHREAGSRTADLALLDELCDTMANGSLCGLGGMTPFPVRSALKHFAEDFESRGTSIPKSDCHEETRRNTAVRERYSLELEMYAQGYHDLGTPAANGARSRSKSTAPTVTVPAGTSIMRAAALAGADIPKLCATDTLKAFGSCRVCLVEIEGRKGFPASCTTEVAAGMKVRTGSEALTRLRRGVLELYVSEHPWARARTAAAATSNPRARQHGIGASRFAAGDSPATYTRRRRSTPAIRISGSTTTRASSVRDVCAPAKTRRERSRSRSRAAASNRASRRPSSSRSSNPNVCSAEPASRRAPPAR